MDEKKRELNFLLDELLYANEIEYETDDVAADVLCFSSKDVPNITILKSASVVIFLSVNGCELHGRTFNRAQKLFSTIWANKQYTGYYYSD